MVGGAQSSSGRGRDSRIWGTAILTKLEKHIRIMLHGLRLANERDELAAAVIGGGGPQRRRCALGQRQRRARLARKKR